MPFINSLAPSTPPSTPVGALHAPWAADGALGSPTSSIEDDAPLLPSPVAFGPDELAAALQVRPGDPAAAVPLTAEAVSAVTTMMDTLNACMGEGIAAMERSMRPAPLPADATPGQRLEAEDHLRQLAELAELRDAVNAIAAGDVPVTTTDTPAHALVLDIQEALHAAESGRGAPLTTEARSMVILGTLSAWVHAFLQNETNTPGLRIASNVVQSTLRTGLIVFTMTFMRQLFGFVTERLLQTHEVGPLSRNLIGTLWMLLGPVALVAGGVRDHLNQTETSSSFYSRITMLGTSLATGIMLFLTDSMTQMASFGAQASLYSYGRDGAQLFFGLEDNANLGFQATVQGGAIWSGLQALTELANIYLAPNSGAGYASSLDQAFANCTDAATTALNAASTLGPDDQSAAIYDIICTTGGVLAGALATTVPSLLRSAFNAVPEIADDMARQTLSLRHSDEGLALRVVPRVPTRAIAADALLRTNAARTTVFNNIYGGYVALDAAIGHLLPEGQAGNFIKAALVSGLSMLAYVPLIQLHSQRAPTNRADIPAIAGRAGPPAPVELTEVRHRTSFDAVV
jgi:hypothetical protein